MISLRCIQSLLFVLCAAGISLTAQALTLHRDGGDLYASGVIVKGDELALQAAHRAVPVRRLILVQSPGGALMTSLRIARWVEGLRITTVAWGPCMSACSLIFMAGEQRQFAQDAGGQTSVIGIHGPYHGSTGQFSAAAAPVMLDYYRHRMGAQYDAEVMEQAIYQMKDPSGFLIVAGGKKGAEAGKWPRHCPSAHAGPHECTVHRNKSAQSLGIVTTAESVSLAGLPPAIETAAQVQPEPIASATLAQRQP